MLIANATHPATVRPRPLGSPIPGMAGLAGLAAIALAALGSIPGSAQAWGRGPSVDRETTVYEGPLAIGIKVRGGTTPLFQAANRPDRWYLQAREGASYEVNVRNTSGDRIAFVIAVDGINAINGTRSHLGSDEPLYVLDPYAGMTVKGWRKDLGNVSKFVFVDEERSYAARTDQANGDLGWIRVVAFHESRPISYFEEPRLGVTRGGRKGPYRGGSGNAPEARGDESRDQAKAAPREEARRQVGDNGMSTESAPAPSMRPTAEKESSPGTGWGSNQRDHARRVEFTPEPYACAQVILRYEYQSALVSLGILPWRGYDRDRLWERENGTLGFSQPPMHR